MAESVHKLLRFGVYEINLDTQELRNAGTLVKLSPQPFKLLTMLVSHAGQIVTREEIEKQLWGDDTYVDFDQGVNKCIKQIRTVLNDNPERPLYIETLPRKGYRFLAPVVSKSMPAPPPRVVPSQSDVQQRPDVLKTTAVIQQPPKEPIKTVLDHGDEPVFRDGRRKSTKRINTLIISVAALIVVGLAAYVSYRLLTPQKPSASKEEVVVADFLNTTGDPVFDGTLKQALTIELEQSPYINALSDRTVAATLRLMNRNSGDRLTQETAREVCLRTNRKVILIGSITPIGDHFLLAVRALNCESGEDLANAQSEVESRSQILPALGDLGNRLRSKLGEELSSIQKFNKPLEEATTSSLEALQAYSLGRAAQITGGRSEDVIARFKQAIALDPNFAYAYAAMGAYYNNLGETNSAMANYKRAYDLRERVSLRERFYIETHYFQDVTQEIEKAIAVYTDWITAYPRDYVPHNNLGIVYLAVGQAERAVREAEESKRLMPENSNAYLSCMRAFMALNRVEEAKSVFDEAKKHNVGGSLLDLQLYYVAFLQQNTVAMQEQVQAAVGRPDVENMFFAAQSDTEAFYGKLEDARNMSEKAIGSAVQNDSRETAALWQAAEGLREAELGSFADALRHANSALQLDSGRDVTAIAAMTFARTGELGRAKLLASQLGQQYPVSTIIQNYILPPILASVEIHNQNPSRAIEILRASEPYEDGDAFLSTANFGNLYPVYVRGLAYLQAKNGLAAAAEFRKMVEHRSFITNNIVGPLSLLQLARAQAMASDHEGARKSYQDLLAIWKNADQNLPALQAAKAEYTKLP